MRIFRDTTLLLVVAALTGCSTLGNAHFGIRPDAPAFNTTVPGQACTDLETYVTYDQNLQEAWHSRASQNRAWIYAAGTIGLATVAATGGLGAAGAAGLSVALVSVGGGFSSGVLAMIDNPTIADIYTISANRLEVALSKARNQSMYLATHPGGCLKKDKCCRSEDECCARALAALVTATSAAKTELERARTDSAVAAVIRAKAQRDELDKLLESLKKPEESATNADSADGSSTNADSTDDSSTNTDSTDNNSTNADSN